MTKGRNPSYVRRLIRENEELIYEMESDLEFFLKDNDPRRFPTECEIEILQRETSDLRNLLEDIKRNGKTARSMEPNIARIA